MILINRAFTEVTPESAEDGEASDSGMLTENEAVTFRELVGLLETHWEASCSRPTGDTVEWYSTGYFTPNHGWADGSEREETLHYSRDNPPRNAKWWRLALVAAGIVKR